MCSICQITGHDRDLVTPRRRVVPYITSRRVTSRCVTHLLEVAQMAILVDGQRHALGDSAHALDRPGFVHVVEVVVVERVTPPGVICKCVSIRTQLSEAAKQDQWQRHLRQGFSHPLMQSRQTWSINLLNNEFQ